MNNKRLGLIIIILVLPLSGCWNYREVEQLSIVAGMAIDKGPKEGQYELTIELIDIQGGTETQPKSHFLSTTGETVFDAVREAISKTGRKLYWSHAKIVIISEAIAREGISKVLDWYTRDAEPRPDANLFVAKTSTAKEIFLETEEEEILSFNLSDMIKNERFLSAAPDVEIWKTINSLGTAGIEPIIPLIGLEPDGDKQTAVIGGSALFKNEHLIDTIGPVETRYYLFVTDEIEGGLLLNTVLYNDQEAEVTLEIFKNSTTVTPRIENGVLTMDIKVHTTVAIDEVMGSADIIQKGRTALEETAEANLKKDIEALIKKVQTEYKTDVFGFGDKIRRSMPKEWKRIEKNWDKIFQDLQVSVACDIKVQGSALLSKPIKTDK